MMYAAKHTIRLIRTIATDGRAVSLACLCALSANGSALTPVNSKPGDAGEFEELIVTATRLPRTTQDIAGTVSVITDATLGQRLAGDLYDLARFLPGITMDSAKRGGHEGFRIRGIGGNRVLTVIDGVRSGDIYEAGPASYGIDSFEVDNLKTVEIIRGPASVLYGADALGGVVLLTSKAPTDYIGSAGGTYFNARIGATSANEQYKLGLTGAFQAGRFGLVSQFTRREFAERQVKGDGRVNPQDGASNALLLKAFWDLSANQRLVASLDMVSKNIDLQLDSDLGRGVTRSVGRDETDRVGLALTYQWDAKTTLFDQLQVSLHQQHTNASQYTKQRRTSYSFLNPVDPGTHGGTPARRTTDFAFNQDTVALAINARKTIDTAFAVHTLAYGFNVDETRTERPRNRCDQQLSTGAMTCQIAAYPFAPTENFPNKTFPDSRTRRNGIYLQDEIVVADTHLTIIPGIRYDNYRMTPRSDALLDSSGIIDGFGYQVAAVNERATTFSLGAIYALSNDISLFAQYSEGYRPPNFDESNQVFVNRGYGYATVPNPALQPESSAGVELGVKAGFDAFNLSLAAYQNDYKDFIESQSVGVQDNISLFQDQNIGRVRIRGAELTANWFLGEQWQLQGALAFAEGEDLATGIALDSIDPLTAVVGIRFDHGSARWGGELLLTAVDEKDRVSSARVVTADHYFVVDLLAHYTLTKAATVRFGVFNLFDTSYARWSSIKGLAADDSTAIDNAQQPGTNFRVALKLSF